MLCGEDYAPGFRSSFLQGRVGQVQLEDGARPITVAGFLAAAYQQTTVVTLDDTTADPETQAGASDAFGGKECRV